jgi:hypothetical protein
MHRPLEVVLGQFALLQTLQLDPGDEARILARLFELDPGKSHIVKSIRKKSCLTVEYELTDSDD